VALLLPTFNLVLKHWKLYVNKCLKSQQNWWWPWTFDIKHSENLLDVNVQNSLTILLAIFQTLASTRTSPFWSLLELRMMEVMVTAARLQDVQNSKLSPPTNQHPAFYRPDALPVTQPTVMLTFDNWSYKTNDGLCERTKYVPQLWNWENHS